MMKAVCKKCNMTKMTGNPFHSSATHKFTADGIPTDLAEKIAPHLEPINYDRWAELEFKDQLTDEEMKEKQVLEKKNMATIEKVYQRLRDDEGVQACIRQIKAHPWVKTIEGV